MQSDVRRHRPPVRPRQPGHDLPPGRPLAARGRRASSPSSPGARRSTSPRAPATSAGPGRRRLPADLRSTFLRHAQRRARGAPGPVRRPRPSAPRPFGRRGHVWLRPPQPRDLPAFFTELARVVRPGGRIALFEVAVPRTCSDGATASTSVTSCPQAAASPIPPPTATSRSPRRLPAAVGRDGRAAASRRVRRRDRTGCHARRGPAARRQPRRSSRTGLMRAVTRRADDATRALDLNDVAPRRRVPVRPGRSRRSPGAGSRPGSRSTACRRCSVRSTTSTRPASTVLAPVSARSPSDGCRSPRAVAGEAVVAGGRRRQGRRRLGAGSPASTTASTATARRRRSPLATAGVLHDRAASRPVAAVPRRRRRGARRGTRRDGSSRR